MLKLLAFLLLFSSCISFNIDSLKDKKAKGVVFKAPPAEYKKKSKEGLDAVWENPTDKTTLSFFSNCSKSNHYTSLAQFESEIVEGLKSFRLTRQKNTSHQGQKARHIYLKKIKKQQNMQIFLFKKDTCFYTLSFFEKSQKNQKAQKVKSQPSMKDQGVFASFIKGFQAP